MKDIILIWLIAAIVILGFMIALGVFIKGRPLGILIDSRSKMSLSRLQLILWTWLLVSSFFAIGFHYETMNIIMSPELWALMGISVGSTAGAIIVKGTKEAQDPDATKVSPAALTSNRRGLLETNTLSKEASLIDMFKGEEIVDFDYIDISKVQLFFSPLQRGLDTLEYFGRGNCRPKTG